MKFSKTITEVIEERTSRRTYEMQLIEQDMKQRLIETLKLSGIETPFSTYAKNCRFKLVAIPEFDINKRKKIGTHGLIKGAQEFIVGAVENSDYNREHFGYLMELIILIATDMGLGTCWLGGFFNRSLFSEKINCTPNEIVPAITPIGYFPEKRRSKEKIIRIALKADQRKPWEQLYFEESFDKPLLRKNAGRFSTLFEMVRLGPSASNRQPWRIVKELNRNNFHFYTIEGKGLYKQFLPLDIGIATCHWDLTAKEIGIEGNWEINQSDILGSEKFNYVISWISN